MKPLMAEDKSTGSAFLDVFDQIRATFGHLGAELGLIIMAVGGFSLVMERVGASEALVNIATKPLAKMNRPYLVLACTYLLAQCLCLIIPSAAGLAMLLIVTVYPLLRSLGISKLSATGVIATGSCLDLGPASRRCPFRSTSSTTVASVCIMHYVVQRHMDRKAGTTLDNADWEEIREELAGQDEPQAETKKVPALYALLPFTPLVVTSIKMNVATAMIISGLIAVVCEMIRFRSFDGMGRPETNGRYPYSALNLFQRLVAGGVGVSFDVLLRDSDIEKRGGGHRASSPSRSITGSRPRVFFIRS